MGGELQPQMHNCIRIGSVPKMGWNGWIFLPLHEQQARGHGEHAGNQTDRIVVPEILQGSEPPMDLRTDARVRASKELPASYQGPCSNVLPSFSARTAAVFK